MGKRWTPWRKEIVLRDLLEGTWNAQELCARDNLTLEELNSWLNLYERGGRKALRVTRMQDNRPGVYIRRRGNIPQTLEV